MMTRTRKAKTAVLSESKLARSARFHNTDIIYYMTAGGYGHVCVATKLVRRKSIMSAER